MVNFNNLEDLCFNVISLDSLEDTSMSTDLELDLEDTFDYALYLYLHMYSGTDLQDDFDDEVTTRRVNEFDLDSNDTQVRVLNGDELAAEQAKYERFMTGK